MMIGRDVSERLSAEAGARPSRRRPELEVTKLGWTDRLSDISFTVGKGEIVGLGGLDGQGQREILLALFGVLRSVDRHGPHPRHARACRRARSPRPGPSSAWRSFRRTARPRA